ncbi:hypothetical protein BDF20DRAFT_21016 [Mycotypha africana]|uniref:uncharacterized protein n=1 Tax=Mycotypha africana TaxID=64632 RepID=UPI0023003817|nr:uncharacterized protein BDF20DRAFT_21016 [Mycotypha africana]KAI8991078.1 hypothetical protein BDF20DRAFT_21016 [Mycotypha africana]
MKAPLSLGNSRNHPNEKGKMAFQKTATATRRASWKRRPSAATTSLSDFDRQQFTSYFSMEKDNRLHLNGKIMDKSKHSIAIKEEEEEGTDDARLSASTADAYPQQHDIAKYYRRSVQLTEQLKSSERNLLASIARDNEDRIVQLQNKVDDMSVEVAKQKKEIQEYKGKEKNGLEQISALETHILSIQRSETDQRQV